MVDFEYPPEIRAFQQEVRDFIRAEWDDEVMDWRRDGMAQLVDSPKRRAFMRKMADRGWLGMSWPVEYGGRGMDGLYEYVFNEELAAVGAPYIGKGVGTVGKTLIRHGSEKLKQEFLPKILRNEIEFAIGYTEPDAGSDLASLSLRATRDDERGGWVLNGQKRFTTSAHFAEWYWVIARTDPDAPKHQGTTLFLTPMVQEGIQTTNMPTIGDERTNDVFLDDVFVPDDHVVGEVGKGFVYVSEALDMERFTMFTASAFIKRYERFRDWIRTAERDGRPLRHDPHVRRVVADLATRIEVAKMLTQRTIDKAARGEVPNIEAAMFKLWGTVIGQDLSEVFLELNGAAGLLRRGEPAAPMDGAMEQTWRYTVMDTVGAGTSEIQRNIIARRGLGLPVNMGPKPAHRRPAPA